MVRVVEVRRRALRQQIIVARFVLEADGTVSPVEVAPRGLALVREALDHGVPRPDGRPGNVPMRDGEAFLIGLSEAYRRASLCATAPFELGYASARLGRDKFARPAPLTLISEVEPHRVAQGYALRLGEGPECELRVPGEGDGVLVNIRWHEGWYWFGPGEVTSEVAIDGCALASMPPSHWAPLDPGARLVTSPLARWACAFDYPLPPGASA
jgi:hypothetical protein